MGRRVRAVKARRAALAASARTTGQTTTGTASVTMRSMAVSSAVMPADPAAPARPTEWYFRPNAVCGADRRSGTNGGGLCFQVGCHGGQMAAPGGSGLADRGGPGHHRRGRAACPREGRREQVSARRPVRSGGAGERARSSPCRPGPRVACGGPAGRAAFLPVVVVAPVAVAWPRQPVGAVGVDAGRELGVEQQLPGVAELGEVRQRAPAHEQVAVGRGLGIAL
jgi:hypothetical protein